MNQAPTRSSKEQFDQQAAFYNGQWSAWSEESLRWLVQHSDVQPTDRLLDVATGTGFTAFAFAPLVEWVTGLDVSPGMLARARTTATEKELHNVEFLEGAAETLPFDSETFDRVTCRIAPHHFLDVRRFVQEVVRVLKPGGLFLLADTSIPDDAPEIDRWQNTVERLRDPSHVRNYSSSEWRRFVAEAGLDVILCEETGGQIPMMLEAWMQNAGCTGENAERVREMFATATSELRETFGIEKRADGDFAFAWRRIVLKARK